MSEQKQYYAISKEGLRKITITDEFIGPQTELLRGWAATVPITVKNFLPDIALAVGKGFVAMAKRLTELKFNTIFRPVRDAEDRAILLPVWKKPGSEMTLTWFTPEDMRLFFVCAWGVDTHGSLLLGKTYPYLVACNKNSITHLLPLPNLHNDGRICLGDDRNNIPANTTWQTFDNALGVFQNTAWNTDLLSGDSIIRTRKMFQFNADGGQLPPVSPWPLLCTRINHAYYQFVATL